MNRDPQALLPRLARLLGLLVLATVLVEAALSAIVGNPTQPPFSTPETRFQMLGGIVQRLVEIVGGSALLTAAYWNHPRESVQRLVGWAFVICSGLALLPLALLIPAFAEHTIANMPPAGLLRFRVQFGRTLLFYATVSLTLWWFGRLLVVRSRASHEPVPA